MATLIQVPAIVFFVTTALAPVGLFAPFVLSSFAVWLFYLWDLPRNELVPLEKEPNWRWGLYLAPFFVEPIYFFRFIWRSER
ncbi:MAG TPA: hypothetical protein VLG15_00180 [Thermoanaerobaculia bacterium]|nr:hypothetical protein [Thermoanaerobaculia bacterium]